MTISCNNISDIPRYYMINGKIDGKFSGKEEITGLNRSEKASLKFPSLSPCLGRTCSRRGLVQVLERMWNLSWAPGKSNSNGRNSTSKGMVWGVNIVGLVALSLHMSKEAWTMTDHCQPLGMWFLEDYVNFDYSVYSPGTMGHALSACQNCFAQTLRLLREFPGSPVVRTPCFHCRGPGFDPWSGKYDPTRNC